MSNFPLLPLPNLSQNFPLLPPMLEGLMYGSTKLANKHTALKQVLPFIKLPAVGSLQSGSRL